MPAFPINPPEKNNLRELERKVKDLMVKGFAYTEVYNYSFVSPQMVSKMGDDISKYLELDNPLSQDRPFLRRHLLTNMLENILKNVDKNKNLKLFEIGKTYLAEKQGLRAVANSDQLLPRQDSWLCGVCVAKKDAFWEAKSVAEGVFKEAKRNYEIKKIDELTSWQHPTRSAAIMRDEETLGFIYELHPLIAEGLGLEEKIGIVEINLDKLANVPEDSAVYKSISEFPAVERDLAFKVKKEVAHEQIQKALLKISDLLKKVELFDVYTGENLGGNSKSMAYHFVYQDPQKTLTTTEVDAIQEKIIRLLSEKFEAEVRV